MAFDIDHATRVAASSIPPTETFVVQYPTTTSSNGANNNSNNNNKRYGHLAKLADEVALYMTEEGETVGQTRTPPRNVHVTVTRGPIQPSSSVMSIEDTVEAVFSKDAFKPKMELARTPERPTAVVSVL